jgi:hypothetical protein
LWDVAQNKVPEFVAELRPLLDDTDRHPRHTMNRATRSTFCHAKVDYAAHPVRRGSDRGTDGSPDFRRTIGDVASDGCRRQRNPPFSETSPPPRPRHSRRGRRPATDRACGQTAVAGPPAARQTRSSSRPATE